MGESLLKIDKITQNKYFAYFRGANTGENSLFCLFGVFADHHDDKTAYDRKHDVRSEIRSASDLFFHTVIPFFSFLFVSLFLFTVYIFYNVLFFFFSNDDSL